MEKESLSYKGRAVYYYHEAGGNNSIHLMHGYSFNSLVWEKIGLIQTLKEMNYSIFALDVPGFPNSINRFALSDDEFVEFLGYFIENAVRDMPVLLGSSQSAYLALRFAESHSSRLRSVIAVAPVRLASIKPNSISVGLLGVWGSDDNTSNPEEGEKLLKKVGNAQVVILKDARHACYLDKPEEFKKAITSFLVE